jgi:hypothetical protein
MIWMTAVWKFGSRFTVFGRYGCAAKVDMMECSLDKRYFKMLGRNIDPMLDRMATFFFISVRPNGS